MINITKENKFYIMIGAFLMALGIVLGAFGAHGLKDILTPHYLDVYKTGVSYHIYHSLGLMIVGIISFFIDNKSLRLAKIFMIIGILLFSGSLYILSITQIKIIGFVTPIGGLFFVVSWIMVVVGLRSK